MTVDQKLRDASRSVREARQHATFTVRAPGRVRQLTSRRVAVAAAAVVLLAVGLPLLVLTGSSQSGDDAATSPPPATVSPDVSDPPDAPAAGEEPTGTEPNRGLEDSPATTVTSLTPSTAPVIQPGQSTRIQCPGNSIITAVSGDPVEDCAEQLRWQGTEPSEMVAYVNERGGVAVVAAGSAIPTGWQPLDGEFRQDTAIIELEAALGDVTSGLTARCYTSADAVPIVERELVRLGLDWSVEITGDEADGDTTCAFATPEPGRSRVVVYPSDPGGVAGTGNEPWVALGTRLDETLSTQCLAVDEAAAVAESIAVDVGLDPDAQQVRISTTIDNNAECARANVTVGGTVFVDVRGPAEG